MFFTTNHGRSIQYPIGEDNNKSLFFYNRHSWPARKKSILAIDVPRCHLLKKLDDLL